ncbi:MAG: hypothetical protein HQL87_11235 [Magnetococcales bacterium]|nr:hypothetical protein [Magnetococcales bacterium]
MEKSVKTVFAHTIGRADFIGGVVRCELNTLIPGDEASERPRSVATHALVMPMDGFLRAFATLEELVRQLTAAEVIHPQQGETTAGGSKQKEAESDEAMASPTSPNFM